jgi:four helix bundle protein
LFSHGNGKLIGHFAGNLLIMERTDLYGRTRKFHIDVIRLCRLLPKDPAGAETAKQLIRSSGSVGANYRVTKRAKSSNDFIYKIRVVLEEADESHYWLEVIKEAELLDGDELDRLIGEANELTSIFSASEKTLKVKKST